MNGLKELGSQILALADPIVDGGGNSSAAPSSATGIDAPEQIIPTIEETVLKALLEQPAIEWVRKNPGAVSPELTNAVASLLKAASFKSSPSMGCAYRDAFLAMFPDKGPQYEMAIPRIVYNSELNELGVPDEITEEIKGFSPIHDAQREGFAKTLPGGLRQSIGTACYLLRAFPDLAGGQLEFNEMTGAITIGRKEIQDSDVTQMRERIEQRFMNHKGTEPIQLGKDMMWDAVLLVAKEHSYHPVREYLDSLKWDTEERLRRVVTEILKTEDTELNRLMFRKFCIACVARAMRPGAKVDNMLVLQGEQGLQKSTFFKTLAGEEWFTDAYIDFDNTKHLMTLRTAWIAEFAEMKSILNTQSEEAVKAGLTRTEDRYVPPYGRTQVAFKRHTVFGGTANPTEILRDPTGNRRYWPMTVGGQIDLEKLAQWRDQLWAEARAAYESGEEWWFVEPEHLDTLRDVQGSYMKSDSWDVPVLDWVQNNYKENPPLDLGTIIFGALSIPTERQDVKVETRVKRILIGAGYQDVRPYVPKGASRRTYYVRKNRVEEFKRDFSARQKAPKQDGEADDRNPSPGRAGEIVG
jgi:hypothetical protein